MDDLWKKTLKTLSATCVVGLMTAAVMGSKATSRRGRFSIGMNFKFVTLTSSDH
jgi:hypothetical protein